MKIKRPIFLATIVLIFVIIPALLYACYNFLLTPASNDETPQMFVVTPGQPLVQIAENLEEKKLVRNAIAFRLLVTQMGIGTNIQAGDFKITPNLTSREIAQLLTHGAIDIWVTFPEGTRLEEQAKILESKLQSGGNEGYVFDAREYLKLGKEGYMFPDTYLIPKDADAQFVAARLQDTFTQKVDDKILFGGAKNNLTRDQVVILASLIEREAITDEEKPIIAGILINRLKDGIALQVDATIQYAKGQDLAKKTWWAPVTQEEYVSVKSPFNTYLHTGFPPTAIASPGLEAIRAAAEPAETEYYFYLHDSKGKIHYAKTAADHAKNIQEFL